MLTGNDLVCNAVNPENFSSFRDTMDYLENFQTLR